MYPLVVNGYAEGWALLAEKMHDRSAEDEKQKLLNEYGRLQMNILRTYRVIADIRLHYFGETVSSVKKEMAYYIKASEPTIDQEIYRYLAIPGQACCYKLGEVKISSLGMSTDEEYKKFLYRGWMPLCML